MPQKFIIILSLILSFLLPQAVWSEAVLHRGNSDEPATLDLHHSAGRWSLNLLQDLYEGLVAYNEKGDLIPGTAERWEVSPDGLVYTFYLRNNAKWSNGDPVTAQDFILSFQRLLDPTKKADYAWLLYAVEGAEDIQKGNIKDLNKLGVKALNDHTLQIRLKSPTPYFLDLLAFHKTAPFHADTPVISQEKSENKTAFISNGPFRFVRWVPGKMIELEKNPNFYAADTIKIDRIFYYPTKDREKALQRFRAGELDILDDVPLSKLEWIKTNLGPNLHAEEFLGTSYYIFNTAKVPFNNAILRQALSMVIDRDQLGALSYNQKRKAFSYVPPGIEGYTPQEATFADWPQEKRDSEAKKILATLGYNDTKPLQFELSYNASGNHEAIAIAIASMWRDKLGIDVTLRKRDTEDHTQALGQGDFEIGRMAWLADYPDPQNFLGLLETKSGRHNRSRYYNQQFDELLEKAALTTDAKERFQLLQKAEKIAVDEQPMIPLFYLTRYYLLQSDVYGWTANGRSIHPSRYIYLK